MCTVNVTLIYILCILFSNKYIIMVRPVFPIEAWPDARYDSTRPCLALQLVAPRVNSFLILLAYLGSFPQTPYELEFLLPYV